MKCCGCIVVITYGDCINRLANRDCSRPTWANQNRDKYCHMHSSLETEADPCDVCPKGTICRTEQIFCINPPCGPDRVRCLDPDEVCDLPPVTGPCKALFRRFFYNATTDQCELFIYGGCGGNDNRFDTRSECIAACGM